MATATRVSLSRDVHHVLRGRCNLCEGEACFGFISVSGRVVCDYCGCPPAKHQKHDTDSEEDEDLSSEDDLEAPIQAEQVEKRRGVAIGGVRPKLTRVKCVKLSQR